MDIDLSIITVNYNSGDDLEKTVKSISPLISFLNAEYILIDGFSDDDSYSRLIDHNVFDVAISEVDGGIYDAMNKGIKLSRGKWIWFLNSGDIALKSARCLKPYLDSGNKSINLLYGNFMTVSGYEVDQNLNLRMLLTGMINHQTIVYRRDILDYFDLNYGLCADFAHLLNSFQKISPLKIDAPLAEYNLYGKSSSFTRSDRVKIWLYRCKAFYNSSLPLLFRLTGMLFSLGVCSIKAFFPLCGSRTLELRKNINK
jgi:glycosyltransferase involved in cell wall biosynthesis